MDRQTPQPIATVADIKYQLGRKHLNGAAQFARQAYVYQHSLGEDDAPNLLLHPYITSAVLMSVAAAEARFREMVDRNDPAWFNTKSRKPLVELLNAYLNDHNLDPLDKTSQCYRSFIALLKLRAGLFHYYPVWDSEQAGQGSLSDILAKEFPPSPFYKDKDQAFFPFKIWHHGCAEWAITTSEEFIRTFEWQAGCQDGLFNAPRVKTMPDRLP
jgi:hypothetical protein